MYFLSEELPDIDSFNDIHSHFDDDPLSGSTTYSAKSLLEEFADELALISYPPDYDDNRACDIESDIREIEFLLFQGDDSNFKDSIDQSVLANRDDLFVDPTLEMFTDEQPPDYSFPPRFDVYPDDFLEIESDADTFDDDLFDSDDFSRDDDLPSPDNNDKVFNPGILSYEKSVKIITRFAQEKKLEISYASWLFEDFDPPFYELLVFKEVSNSMRLLPFSSENEEKVFKSGIYTSKKFHCCFLFELSYPDSGGGIGTEKKSNVTGMSGFSVDFGFPSLSQVAGTTCQDGGNNNTPIEVGHEYAMKKTPTSYVNKLSPISLTKANLWVDLVLRDGSWMIRGVLIFLNKWSPSVSLLKEELSRVPVWVKFHDVPLVAYTSDGLSLIAMKIGTSMMLDSYTNSMCLESWGSNSYARILIKINACNSFSDNLIMTVLKLKGPGYTKETILNMVEKGKGESFGADDEVFIEVKNKKSCVKGVTKNFKPVLMKPKPQFHPKVNQTTVDASPKKASSAGKSSKQTDMTNATTLGNGIIFLSNSFKALNDDDPVTVKVESGTKASTFGMQVEGNSSTPLVENIHRFKQLMDGKCVLVDEDGKPIEKVDYLGDHGSEDEVEPDDNKMTSFLASKLSGVRYGTKSLLEQWMETYGDYEKEYNYDPYDDDMYEGQDIPDNIHTICNNLDIKMTTLVGNNSVFKSFFEKQKLTGPNFIDWYRQLHLVLLIEDKENYLEHHILTAPVAPPGQQVPPAALATHAAWVKGQKEVDNYNMHGMGKTVNELHAMLKLHEETLPKKDAN
nr:hypothetical protein [Tanacetum cinerariifolium]